MESRTETRVKSLGEMEIGLSDHSMLADPRQIDTNVVGHDYVIAC